MLVSVGDRDRPGVAQPPPSTAQDSTSCTYRPRRALGQAHCHCIQVLAARILWTSHFFGCARHIHVGKIKYREQHQNDINGDQCTWRASLRHGDAPKGARSMYNVGSSVCACHSLWRPTPKRRHSRTARKREVARTWPTRRRRARAMLLRTARAREVARTWPSYEMVRGTAQSSHYNSALSLSFLLRILSGAGRQGALAAQ